MRWSRSFRHLLIAAWLVAAHASVRTLHAQPQADTIRQVVAVVQEIEHLGRTHGDSIWPGFRPDTIPVLCVLPQRGAFLANWHPPLPEGFSVINDSPSLGWRDATNRSSANTTQELNGRTVAELTVTTLEPSFLVATGLHEAMHVLERASIQPGRRFGRAENSYYVATYPVFDAENEAGFALEGRVLGAALDASSISRKRDLARQFVAVRRSRLRHLDPDFGEFDVASELNEGIAEYALVRALDFIVADGPPAWRARARATLGAHRSALDSLTDNGARSSRLRYYYTGPAMARLLDALVGPAWKSRLVDDNETLQDALAFASGLDDEAAVLRRRAAARFSITTLLANARREVTSLERRRKAQVDSVLARPGLHLELLGDSIPGGDFAECGFDPQNLLAVTPSEQLHTRWVHPCSNGTDVDLTTATVHDDSSGSYRAVSGPADCATLTADDRAIPLASMRAGAILTKVKLTAPGATVSANRAELRLVGDTLWVRPLRTE